MQFLTEELGEWGAEPQRRPGWELGMFVVDEDSDIFLKMVFLSEIILFWTTNMAKNGLNDINSSNKNGDFYTFIGTLDV